MDKREKVINGLQDIRKDYEDMRCKASMAIIDDALALLKAQEQDAQREYEAAVEMAEYCERYEPTYNPEDGSM